MSGPHEVSPLRRLLEDLEVRSVDPGEAKTLRLERVDAPGAQPSGAEAFFAGPLKRPPRLVSTVPGRFASALVASALSLTLVASMVALAVLGVNTVPRGPDLIPPRALNQEVAGPPVRVASPLVGAEGRSVANAPAPAAVPASTAAPLVAPQAPPEAVSPGTNPGGGGGGGDQGGGGEVETEVAPPPAPPAPPAPPPPPPPPPPSHDVDIDGDQIGTDGQGGPGEPPVEEDQDDVDESDEGVTDEGAPDADKDDDEVDNRDTSLAQPDEDSDQDDESVPPCSGAIKEDEDESDDHGTEQADQEEPGADQVDDED